MKNLWLILIWLCTSQSVFAMCDHELTKCWHGGCSNAVREDAMTNESSYSLRPIQVANLDEVAALHVQSWRDTYAGIVPDEILAGLCKSQRKTMWSNILSSNELHSRVIGAFSNNILVGFVHGGKARQSIEECGGELYSLYVSKEAQMRGIGSALVTSMFEHMKSVGFNKVFLWVLAENPGAKFYSRIGGTVGPEQTIRIGEKQLREKSYVFDLGK